MTIQELNKYKVSFIRNKTGKTIYGQPVEVVDEGNLFRIQELHVIWKSTVEIIEKTEDVVKIIHKNGDWVELGVVE